MNLEQVEAMLNQAFSGITQILFSIVIKDGSINIQYYHHFFRVRNPTVHVT